MRQAADRRCGASIVALAAALGAALALTGCGSTPTPEPTGFLQGGYGEMQPTDPYRAEQIRSPRLDELAEAQSFCVAEPTVTAEPLNEAQKARLRQALRKSLEKELARNLPVTPEGTAGCALVRANVIKLEKSNVTANFVVGVLSPLPVIPSTGAVAIEAEALSPADGHQIAAILWANRGSPFSLISGLKPTGQARDLTREFARRFATVLSPAVQSRLQAGANPGQPQP
jgi:hypothetical protein